MTNENLVVNIYLEKNGMEKDMMKMEIKKYSKYHDLLYEYEFIYGNKNGKGREFLNKKLVFEGEYVNGSINGKVKNYSLNGNIIFEGEYLYNQKLKGKEYYKGKLEYEGEYLLQ